MLTIQLFAGARQLAGMGRVALELPLGGTVADLQAALLAQIPALAPILPHARWAVNQNYARLTDIIPANAEVALIPPVSGG